MLDDVLDIARGVVIPRAELQLTGVTGGGPGGQHVNRSATRIELRWTPSTSAAFAEMPEERRERILRRLAPRLDQQGSLRIVAGEYRSQARNRVAAVERLRDLVANALQDPRPRRATRPTRSSVEKRLTEKKRRAHVKRERRRPPDD